MRRARKVRDELAPALFPFLAVLVCTMGALVLLLMLIVSQARASARQQVADLEQIEQAELDGLYLTVEALQLRRKQFQEQVDQLRDEASHYEDHLSRLQEEHRQLAARAESLETLVRSKESLQRADAERLEAELERLREELAQAEAELEDGKHEADGRGPAFAIIPYQGGSGTRRRPIYLECTSQGVIVQPEGVLLGLDDLRPPHGPGNPLETVLRTIRSGLQETDGYQHLSESPYPLLLVRPDGIASYALARAAMAGWDDRFGYELITADMPLAFPVSPPGLGTKIATALERARQRRVAMLAALPGMRAVEQEWNDQLPGGGPALAGGQGPGEAWGPGGMAADGLSIQAAGLDGDRWVS
jgi:hypothetical protein